jgi:AbrB family looped-hinge helix DNA binding protein
MLARIDGDGRLIIPKELRDELGFVAGTELELEAVDGHLQATVVSRVGREEGQHGLRFVVTDDRVPQHLTDDQVRRLRDRGRG